MNMSFFKYQGTGNDFILIDDFERIFPQDNNELIRTMCDRRFGIGADGLILLLPSTSKDFKMTYFNSNGYEGTMCGNGGRCLLAFARDRGRIFGKSSIYFDAIDGEHEGYFIDHNTVCLKMRNVSGFKKQSKGYRVNTGSVHHVEYVDNLVDIDVYRRGRTIRRHNSYAPDGCNVNFIQPEKNGTLSIRTYERGVEKETLSCGTGSVASAIVHHATGHQREEYIINTRGGILKVSFHFHENIYQNIWLEGPATYVFKGEIKL